MGRLQSLQQPLGLSMKPPDEARVQKAADHCRSRRRVIIAPVDYFLPRFSKSASMRSFQPAASGAAGQARTLDTASLMTS